MKCPKCGYHSFEHLDSCKKCSADLSEHKAKFGIRGFFSPGQAEPEAPLADDAAAADAVAAEEENVDFGFDFLDEEGDAAAAPVEEVAAAEEPQADEAPDELAGAFDESEEDAVADEGLSLGDEEVSIDQPFGIDGETVPADDLDEAGDKEKKAGPDSEFSF